MRAELDSLPPDVDETAEALTRLPQLAENLADRPQPILRRLYGALDLRLRYQPSERAVDIEFTLTDAIGDMSALVSPEHRVGPTSQVCSVHPTGQRTNCQLVVEGPELAVVPARSKVRRDGYLNTPS
jgi:hypothetical protein